MDWIDLAEDRDRWRAVVNGEWTFGFHKMRGISWPAENRLASQEGLCSVELVISFFRIFDIHMCLAIYAQGVPQKRVFVRNWCVCQLLMSLYIHNSEVSVNSVSLPHTKFSENPYSSLYKVKDKAVPLQPRRGPEGSRKLRFPDFVITAEDGGKVVSLTHRPPFCYRLSRPQGHSAIGRILCQWKIHWYQLESNPRPSDL